MLKLTVRIGLSVILVGCGTVAARAIPIEVDLTPVDNSPGGPELEGFTTTDVVLTIPGIHTGSQMLIELEQGTIYQHPLGGIKAPTSGAVAAFPAVAYDSYLAYGAHTEEGPFGPFNAFGAAVNLKPEPSRSATFSAFLVDVAWAPEGGGHVTTPTEGFVTARITLSDDAEGRWLYLASSVEEFTVIAPEDHPLADSSTQVVYAGSGLIRAGELRLVTRVPEPGSVGLLAIAVLGGLLVIRFGPSRTRLSTTN